MNTLLDNGQLKKMMCGNNFAYLLEDNTQFLSTEYKVLQSQEEGCFVKMMKAMYNGKDEFYYLVDGYKSLKEMIPILNADAFMTVVSNLLSNIVKADNNGFLSCRNIDASYEHIFIDPNTYEVRLIYLPASIHFYKDDTEFENELRIALRETIATVEELRSFKTEQFAKDLANGMLSMQELLMKSKGVNCQDTSAAGTASLQIVALDSPKPLTIMVTKDEFILGKKADRVDGVIAFNNMISRVHCKINRQADGFTVTDLQSANGTYINHTRLQPQVACPIRNHDIIRMANSDFRVVIK